MAFGMNFFRKYQGRLILALAVLLMITWAVGGAMTRFLTPEPVAGTAFGEKVTSEEFRLNKHALSVLRLGKAVTDEDAWEFVVVLHEAERLGVRVSEEEVIQGIREWIKAMTGAPDENLDNAYSMIRSRYNLSDGSVRFAMQKELMASKVFSMVAGASVPTDVVAWQEYRKEALQVRLKTLTAASVDSVSEAPKPSQEQLTAYFAENEPAYRIPQRATIEYAAALKANYVNLFTVSDEKVEKYYEKNKVDKFLLDVPEPDIESTAPREEPLAIDATDASEAPIEIEPTAPAEALPDMEATDAAASEESLYRPLEEVEGEIRNILLDQEAEDILTDVKIDVNYHKEWTLKDVAERYGLPYFSLGPASADEKEKFGGLGRATVNGEKTVMEVVFPRAPEEAYVARGEDGVYVFKVVSTEDEHQPGLDEVRDKVSSDFIMAEAQKIAMRKAAEALDVLKVEGWDAFRGAQKYRIEEWGLSRTQKFEALAEAASTVELEAFGGPVLGPDGAYVFQVLDRKEPEVESFEMYKGFIKSMYAMRQRQAFLDEWKKDLIARANIEKAALLEAEEIPETSEDSAPLY